MGNRFTPIFHIKHEGISYWVVPSFLKSEEMEWLTFDKHVPEGGKWKHYVPKDDIPKEVMTEYMLWILSGKVDKQ